MKNKLPKTIPLGRLPDLWDREDANLIAYTTPKGIFDEYILKKFKTRESLEEFCDTDSKNFALVKTPVAKNMMINNHFQFELKDQSKMFKVREYVGNICMFYQVVDTSKEKFQILRDFDTLNEPNAKVLAHNLCREMNEKKSPE